MGVDLPGLGELSRRSEKPAAISSTCVVFAETEIIVCWRGRVAPDIAAGVQASIASRVANLAGRALARPVCFTGGVALQPGMIRALEDALRLLIRVAPDRSSPRSGGGDPGRPQVL